MWRAPLIRKNKALARSALYLGAILLPLLVWWLIGWLSSPIDVEGTNWFRPVAEFEAMESVRLFQEYLRIDTSPEGSEHDGAEFLARHLEAAGIETHVERLGEHHANLWAVIEGDDPEALVLHNHIDVDPILDANSWRHPPFGGVIDLPWLYGRGAFDMKSVTIAQLMAMLELRRSGITPRRSVIFLATGDEERGSRMGTRWLLREHPEVVARFGAVLTEGGVVEAVNAELVKYWGTEFAQNRFVVIEACHSRRERVEALYEDVLALDSQRFERRLTPQIAAFLREYSATRDAPQIGDRLREPEALLQAPELRLPEYLQLMLRNEVSPSVPEKNPEGGYRLRLLLSLVPGVTLEQALPELLPAWMTHGIALSFDETSEPAPPSDTEHPIFVAVDEFMAHDLPEVVHGPMFIPRSVTDARFFRAAGIPSYGYSPFLIVSTDTLQMAGRNERMALPAFVDGVERYVELVRWLVSPEPVRAAHVGDE